MKSIAFSAAFIGLVQLGTLAIAADNYRQAYAAAQETGKPLVVLVGADWCPGCQTMHNTVMPQLASRGDLNKVAFAQVNTDREGPLANQLMSGTRIPQLVMYTKTADGWRVDRMVGAQSPESVEEFLSRASAMQTVAAVQNSDSPTE